MRVIFEKLKKLYFNMFMKIYMFAQCSIDKIFISQNRKFIPET